MYDASDDEWYDDYEADEVPPVDEDEWEPIGDADLAKLLMPWS